MGNVSLVEFELVIWVHELILWVRVRTAYGQVGKKVRLDCELQFGKYEVADGPIGFAKFSRR